MQSLDARYERVESVTGDEDVFVVNAEMHGVAARLLITRDPDAEGAFRVTCTRLGGDTFAYHEAFRQLRQLLGDAVQGGVPLNKLGLSKLQQSSSDAGSSSGLGGRGRAPALLGLAPMPTGGGGGSSSKSAE